MRLARALGAIGRALISAGVIVLLFVAYQLWGTGLQHSAAQNNLGSDFAASTGVEASADAESLAEAAAASRERIDQGLIFTNNNDALTVADGDDAGPARADLSLNDFSASERQQILAELYPDEGEPFARIVIQDINVDQITVEGVSVEDLRKGPGHYQSTPNPGQAGNAGIAGHRTTYGAPFHRVDELQPGDPIFVTTAQGTFEYLVLPFSETGSRVPYEEVDDGVFVDGQGAPVDGLGYFIVSPSDTWVLDQGDENLLTLTACHPKYSARQRIIVQAVLVGEPVLTIPRDEAVDIGSISLDSGASDEEAGDTSDIAEPSEAIDADVPVEEQVIIGDDVAADDDPTVDADGDPIEDTAPAAAAATDDVDSDQSATDEVELTASEGPLSTDDFGEGLNGDPTKVKPAIMWGIAGLFVWMAAWFMGNQLDRKWTLYAVALLPFGFVLWSTFVNVDQALPSY